MRDVGIQESKRGEAGAATESSEEKRREVLVEGEVAREQRREDIAMKD